MTQVVWQFKVRLLALTCILLLPQSATMMFPLTSTATPVGALNWPLPSPLEPNFSRNSPSVLNTCTTRMNHIIIAISFITFYCHCAFLSRASRRLALTLTEWLWKSVTMISLLLLTAAKWGPWNQDRRSGSSQGVSCLSRQEKVRKVKGKSRNNQSMFGTTSCLRTSELKCYTGPSYWQ